MLAHIMWNTPNIIEDTPHDYRYIGRYLCTSLCASVITCRHMICLQINVLTHDAQGKMVLAERLEQS